MASCVWLFAKSTRRIHWEVFHLHGITVLAPFDLSPAL